MESMEIRRKAADLIEERGWVQDAEGGGRVCLVVALNLAADHVDDSGSGSTQLRRTKTELRKELGVDNLVIWNDEPSTTKEQVLAALRGQSS